MSKYLKYVFITIFVFIVLIGIICFSYATFFIKYTDKEEKFLNSLLVNQSNPIKKEAVIKPDTKFVYNYHYVLDDEYEIIEEDSPYFLLDMTEEEVKKIHNDFNITKFSEDEVHLNKDIDKSSDQKYLISIKDGYVAVFYTDNGVSKLKETTNKPIIALSQDDVNSLKKGINVYGEENLARILEDYES